MTEKQYKGIAGNFLICDVQKEYAEHLLSILVKRFGMRFQFHFFSNVKKIEQFAEKAEIEILLIAEDCVSEIRGNVKAKKKFILSESMKKEEKQGETTIFRYQSADEILKIIQSGIGEEEAKAAHKPQKKTEEKYDAVQSDFTAPKRKIGIRDEPEESGLIGIYSPIHRIGKTEFALCLGEKISEKVPTLYINMEGYSGNDFYFKGEKNQDLGDLLYYLKQERIDYGLKASLMTGQYKQLDYIMPISNENDLREVTKKEWIYFLDTIMDQCIYKAVILDLGDCVSGLYDILKKCSRIYTPYGTQGIDFRDYDCIKDLLVVELERSEFNGEHLSHGIFEKQPIGALVLYLRLEQKNQLVMARLGRDVLEVCGVSQSTMMKQAMENTIKINPPVVMPVDTNGRFPYFILSNREGRNGATAITYPGMLEQLRKMAGMDFYVIPANIHEVLIVGKTENAPIKYLREALKQRNREMGIQQMLSDHVYEYSGRDKKLKRCLDEKKKNRER